MSIPKYDEIQLPALNLLSNGDFWTSRQLEPLLAKHFNLTDEEVNQQYESGKGSIFLDRINWALSYINMAGCVSKPKRGVFQINDTGREILKTPERFSEFISKQIQLRDQAEKKKAPVTKQSILLNYLQMI